jgi:hypothetical protein
MKAQPEIVILPDGFMLRHAPEAGSVNFDAVVEIHAQKSDLLTVDEIRVAFVGEDGETISVSEEWNGYEELMKVVFARFPRADASWIQRVVLPPFAPCPVVIWRKTAEQSVGGWMGVADQIV